MNNIFWKERLLAEQEGEMTEKQMRIVIAAIELFGAKGYASVSTKEIAQHADVAEGTIFKHYATKKELLLSVSHIIMDHFLLPSVNEGLDDLIRQPYEQLEDFLAALLENRLALIRRNLPVFKVILQETLFHPELKMEFRMKIQEISLPQGLTALQEQNMIIDLPVGDLFKLILTAFFGFIFSRYILMPELIPDTDEERRLFIEMMARGLSPKIITEEANLDGQ